MSVVPLLRMLISLTIKLLLFFFITIALCGEHFATEQIFLNKILPAGSAFTDSSYLNKLLL